MSHFSPADWVDFTRGLLPRSESMGLQNHLDKGCEECLDSVALWRALLQCVSQAEEYRAPEHVLRHLRAEYITHRPWKWLGQAARWAELVFDSVLQPAPALVRGSTLAKRQVIHEAEPFVIDLRIESDSVQNRLLLMGQVLNSENPDEALPCVDVILLSGEDLVAKTAANSSGEFELQFQHAPSLHLFINIRGQRAIGVILPRMEMLPLAQADGIRKSPAVNGADKPSELE